MPRSPIHTTVSSRTPISLYRRPDRCRDRDDLLPHPDRASVMLPELRDQPVARKHWAFGVEAVSTPGTTPSGPAIDSTNHRSEYCRRATPLRPRSSTDRASDYGSEGWGVESLRAPHTLGQPLKWERPCFKPLKRDASHGRDSVQRLHARLNVPIDPIADRVPVYVEMPCEVLHSYATRSHRFSDPVGLVKVKCQSLQCVHAHAHSIARTPHSCNAMCDMLNYKLVIY